MSCLKVLLPSTFSFHFKKKIHWLQFLMHFVLLRIFTDACFTTCNFTALVHKSDVQKQNMKKEKNKCWPFQRVRNKSFKINISKYTAMLFLKKNAIRIRPSFNLHIFDGNILLFFFFLRQTNKNIDTPLTFRWV